jgi:predicted transcriptional regulator
LCYRADFTPQEIAWKAVDIDTVPEFSSKRSSRDRILLALRAGPVNRREMADLGLPSGTLRVTLHRLREEGLIVERNGQVELAEA